MYLLLLFDSDQLTCCACVVVMTICCCVNIFVNNTVDFLKNFTARCFVVVVAVKLITGSATFTLKPNRSLFIFYELKFIETDKTAVPLI